MLKKGQFIKEAPPKIGAQYIPRSSTVGTSKEEMFAQDIILLKDEEKQRSSVLAKILGSVLRA